LRNGKASGCGNSGHIASPSVTSGSTGVSLCR
jgi:hypothetical protein